VGATQRFHETADALSADCFLWLAMDANGPHRPQDALRYPDATHLLRIPTPRPDETPAAWFARVRPILDVWVSAGIPPGALIVIHANEPEQQGADVPVPWAIDAWLAAAHGYRDAILARYPNLPLLAPPLTCGNTHRITAAYIAGYPGIATHNYWSAGNPGWRQGRDGGQAWRCATDLGAVVYVTELGSNPQDAGELLAWLGEVDSPLVLGATVFIADGAACGWGQYDLTIEQAAAVRAGLATPPPSPQPAPSPPPPEPEPPMGYTRDYDPRGYRPLDPRWRPFIAGRNPAEADAICAAIDEAARRINYDANAMAAQACVETAVFTSARWRVARAAAGIGIYSDGTPDVQWGSIENGIHAQADLLTAYFGNDEEPYGTLAPHGFGGMRLGKTRLSDLDGVWAADRGYSAAIVGYLNSVLGGDAPASPPEPPSGVTGDQVAAEALSQLNRVRSGAYDTRNGDHPWYLWCESFVERVHEHCGLTVAAAVSAADKGRAMEAAGRLHRGDGDAPRGAVLFWDEGFWADGGHTAISLGDGTFVGTTDQGIQIRSGWQQRAGYMGWAFYPGVGDTPPAPPREDESIVVTVDGHIDDGRLDAVWYGRPVPTKTQLRSMPRVKGHGIPDRWESEFRAKKCLGQCLTKEMDVPDGSGARIQFFANGWIVWYPDGTTSVN
jgi:hypothetical protein